MELKEAISIANRVKVLLTPYCDVIHIAGSIRRGKQEPKDIEIVCLPSTIPIMDVFGDESSRRRVKGFITAVAALGKITKGSPIGGRYVRIELEQDIALDLFIPPTGGLLQTTCDKNGSCRLFAQGDSYTLVEERVVWNN